MGVSMLILQMTATSANLAHALDGGIPALLDTAHAWPAASDEHRSAAFAHRDDYY